MKDTILIHEIENPTTGVFDYIPVESEFKYLCAHCDKNDIEVLVDYYRTGEGQKNHFHLYLCADCLLSQDVEEELERYDEYKIIDL